jgi:hypothetical protein
LQKSKAQKYIFKWFLHPCQHEEMTVMDVCPRCCITETSRHLLYECVHIGNIWSLFNNLI